MQSSTVRSKFLDFFRDKNHQIVASAPIVVKNDPTLMFTNAGMNQFKDIFLGNEEPPYKRVADTQKCLRVSGKHNDLEEVGVDTYHHTMFEMLGNWSFGDYYKKEAIHWAWELLTKIYELDPDRLYVSVFKGDASENLPADEEAYAIWQELVSEDRIIKADKKDNFWEMGETGPCGPCSEIHVDLRPDAARQNVAGRDLVNADHPQVVEIWNLVFMELMRTADGKLKPLPRKHIDTGMGFERLCMALQGKESTYDTDVFSPLIEFISAHTGIAYTHSDSQQDIAQRVMADHIRAVTFAIADGQLPSNTGAGYVIRRILRRAVRYGYSFLNIDAPFLCRLSQQLVAQLGEVFQELKLQKELIYNVIREEEEAFLRTLSRGMQRISAIVESSNETTISGELVFELYDTYGFPEDLTALILAEHNKSYDKTGFDKALQQQKNRSRAAGSVDTGDWIEVAPGSGMDFIGYDTLKSEVKLVKYRSVKTKKGQRFQLVFDKTPFYPEGGGQVGDTGYIEDAAGNKIAITDTKKENNLIVHFADQLPADPAATFTAVVESELRLKAAANHSATHLLHQALREILGSHVQQKGSLVTPAYLRFDFAHFSKVEPEQLKEIERRVNALIRQNIPLQEFRAIPISEAKEMGAIALFGEKYGDQVRTICFADSIELCGGTHAGATGEIGLFKITSEGSVAAGIRRIEAVSGREAEMLVEKAEAELAEISQLLKTPNQPLGAVQNVLSENAALKQQIEQFKKEQAKNLFQQLKSNPEKVGDINFIAAHVDADAEVVKDLIFRLRQEVPDLVAVLGTSQNEKATLSVAISDNLVGEKGLNAGKIVREQASKISGGGGGQAHYATAGGKNPSGLAAAFDGVREMLRHLGS